MKIPIDNKIATEYYLQDNGGICGQSCLAVIEKRSISDILKDWNKYFGVFRGWSKWKELKQFLENKNYQVKLLRKDSWGNFNKEDFIICRIQWLGNNIEKMGKPFYGYGHWTEASAHTHFIVLNNNKFFCNEMGIFEDLENYLDGKGISQSGVITSMMRIKK